MANNDKKMSKMHQMMQIKSLGRIDGDWVIWEKHAENKAKRAEAETQGISNKEPLVSLVSPTPTRSQSSNSEL